MLKEKVKNVDKKLLFILTVAFLMRFIGFWEIPTINIDECYAFYTARCLINYGVDLWGKTLSVYSSAWGAGMSMGMTYISIPFLLIFGQNIFAFRLPMVVGGVVATYFMYKIGCYRNKNTGYIMALLYGTVPWSVMQQRFGMDCNLFIVLFIPGLYYMMKYLFEEDTNSLYTSMFIWGFSLFGYVLSYLYLPIFLIVIIISLLLKKKFKLKEWIIACLIIGIIALPLMVFVFNNILGLELTKFGIFDFPELLNFRSSEIGFKFENIERLLNVYLFQNDFYKVTTFQNSGLMYYVTMPLIIMGTYCMFAKEKSEFNNWMKIIFLISTGVPALLIQGTNSAKIMILIIPMCYQIVLGIEYLQSLNLSLSKEVLNKWLTGIYVFVCCSFFGMYILNQNSYLSKFDYIHIPEVNPHGLSEVIKFTEENYPNEEKYFYYIKNIPTSLFFNELNINPNEKKFEETIYTYGNDSFLRDYSRIEDYYFGNIIQDGHMYLASNGKEPVPLKDSLIISMCNMEELKEKNIVYQSHQYCLYK